MRLWFAGPLLLVGLLAVAALDSETAAARASGDGERDVASGAGVSPESATQELAAHVLAGQEPADPDGTDAPDRPAGSKTADGSVTSLDAQEWDERAEIAQLTPPGSRRAASPLLLDRDCDARFGLRVPPWLFVPPAGGVPARARHSASRRLTEVAAPPLDLDAGIRPGTPRGPPAV